MDGVIEFITYFPCAILKLSSISMSAYKANIMAMNSKLNNLILIDEYMLIKPCDAEHLKVELDNLQRFYTYSLLVPKSWTLLCSFH